MGYTQLECNSPFGGYEPIQGTSAVEYCVDDDGWQFTPNYIKQTANYKCYIEGCDARVEECTNDEDTTIDEEDYCEYCPSTCT